jgi:hypothetical protein
MMKMVVIGDLKVSKSVIQKLIKSFGLKMKQIEFIGYKESKSKTKKQMKGMDVILVGAMPHSTKATDGCSSAIESMRQEDGFPPIIECRNSSGQLVLNKQSISWGLEQAIQLIG